MPTETTHDIADAIAIRHAGPTAKERFDLTAEVKAALDAERERCAMIALRCYPDCLHCKTAARIADEIRGKD